MRDSRIHFIREQGFEGTAFPDSFYTALMFQPRAIAALAVLGALAHGPWLFLALAAVLWWSATVPAFNPFDAIYNHAVAYPRRLPPLGEAPPPRRFAEGLAGTVAAVVGVAFLVGETTTAWFFAAVFIVASMAAVGRDSCFGAYVYHQLRRWQAGSSKHSSPNGVEGPLIQHRH